MNVKGLRLVEFAKLCLQDAADQDRDAAYAEDAERSIFTIENIHPGFQFKGYGGATRIVARVSDRYVGVDTDYISRTGDPMNLVTFVGYLNNNQCFRKIAP